jgi:type I restriction enzyme S subunit
VCRGLEGAIANNLFRVIPKDGHVSNDFLYWFLKSPAFQDEIKEIMNGAAMPAISFGVINEIAVAFPPQRDQLAIVSKLESFAEETQRLARLYERKHAALEALKKSLLHQAFNGEL